MYPQGIFYEVVLGISGLHGNKLVQVWNMACHFYLCSFRLVVRSRRERTVVGLRYKNRISQRVHLNVTSINCTLTIFQSVAGIFYL